MASDHPHPTRRALLGGLLAASAFPALANAPERSLRPLPRPSAPGARGSAPAVAAQSVERLLQRANLGGVTGFIALDAQSGTILEEHGADQPLPPASVAKAPSALFAIHALGMEHRFITRVLARGGAIAGGVLRGDLVLQGGGDPGLQTEDMARMADALIAQGLRRVEGRFLLDDSALPEISQIATDQPVQAGYNPAISGLNLNYNRVHFQWAPSGGQMRLTMDARSNREVPAVSVIRIEARDRGDPVYTYANAAGREAWTVSRQALGNGGSRWLPVRRPGPYAGDVLRALLAARGCTLPAPQAASGGSGGAVLAENRSAQLSEMAREMLRFSTNITAECVGLTAARRLVPGIAALPGSGQVMAGWLAQRYGAQGLQFADHSGLSDASRVTARGMGAFFLAAHREGILPGLLRRHTMRDAQGREMNNHPVAVHAKTGTLNFVNGLGGYVRAPGGREIVFAIFSGDLPRRATIPVQARDRPPGAQEWARRARTLQQGLIERWAATYG
ncbi:D-alanyl-D-alanine carboxypeptidase/D-alanyl-D-alanine endopeptidase [Pararhodobacter sp.]|uniref:D-alanyl-D-alanine carboxypeptidase/D-alanyl-D-alanine endopeptidase n=1 Tax=Pararhodobacter sp. TaxID=2127056 RepID=UPI002FDD3D8F